GHVWQWRLGILAAAWLAWWRWGRTQENNRGLLLFTLFLIAALAFTRSASGHPADQGDFTLREFNDWLHLAAAAVWMGAVMVSALVLFPRLRNRRTLGTASIQRLSNLAGAALVLTLATGVCNAWWALPALADLWTTDYGRLLLVKLALVAVLILFGAVNRYYFLPDLRAAGDAPALHKQFALSLILESLAMVATMNVVAQLTQGVPPKT
ncbi:MAG: CopD family protein, partial [Gammaproteobacteria bacterium]